MSRRCSLTPSLEVPGSTAVLSGSTQDVTARAAAFAVFSSASLRSTLLAPRRRGVRNPPLPSRPFSAGRRRHGLHRLCCWVCRSFGFPGLYQRMPESYQWPSWSHWGCGQDWGCQWPSSSCPSCECSWRCCCAAAACGTKACCACRGCQSPSSSGAPGRFRRHCQQVHAQPPLPRDRHRWHVLEPYVDRPRDRRSRDRAARPRAGRPRSRSTMNRIHSIQHTCSCYYSSWLARSPHTPSQF